MNSSCRPSTDVSSVLGSVRANTPDLLVCVMHDQDSLLIARQMVASNTNVKLLFQGLGPQLASFREALGKYSEAICCARPTGTTVPYKDKFFGDSRKFVEYYKSKFTRPIAYHTAGAAACIETYILAMQAAKSIQARGGARRAGGRRLRDLLQPHQVHARRRRRCHPHGQHDRPGAEGQARDRVPRGGPFGEGDLPAPAWDKKA